MTIYKAPGFLMLPQLTEEGYFLGTPRKVVLGT